MAGIGATIAYGRWTLGSLVVVLTVGIELSDIVLRYLRLSKKAHGPLEPPVPETATVEEAENALKSPEIVDS